MIDAYMIKIVDHILDQNEDLILNDQLLNTIKDHEKLKIIKMQFRLWLKLTFASFLSLNFSLWDIFNI